MLVATGVLPKKLLDETPQLINWLSRSSLVLEEISSQFSEIKSNFHIISFYEARHREIQFTETHSTETRTTEGYKVTSEVVTSILGPVQSSSPVKERCKPMSSLGKLHRKVGSKSSDKLLQLLGNHDDEFELPFDGGEVFSKPNLVEMTRDGSAAAPKLAGTKRMGTEVNHTNIGKFDDADSPGYKAVARDLLQYSLQADHTVEDRWAKNRRDHALEKPQVESSGMSISNNEQHACLLPCWTLTL